MVGAENNRQEPTKGLVTMGTRWGGWRLSGPVPPRPAGVEQACPLCACQPVALGLGLGAHGAISKFARKLWSPEIGRLPMPQCFFLPQSFIHSTFTDVHCVSSKASGTERRKPQSSLQPFSSCNTELHVSIRNRKVRLRGGSAELAGMGCDSYHHLVASCLPYPSPLFKNLQEQSQRPFHALPMVAISCHLASAGLQFSGSHWFYSFPFSI